MKRIHKVAVLGAGTMGARIAAHFANAGVPSYLLDIVPPDADGPARNKIAAAGLEAARKSKPAAFYEPSLARPRDATGNFDDDLERLADCDWIIEAVVENIDIKRALLEKVEPSASRGDRHTNTSGLPIAKIAEGFPTICRKRWFGTHFFNPPRYMRLVEIIPTPETDPEPSPPSRTSATMRLGKGSGLRQGHAQLHRQPHRHVFSSSNVMRLMQQRT